MIDEKSRVPNPKAQFELIDKDGNKRGVFYTAAEAAAKAKELWPDQEQDEDRTGKGWDIQTAGIE